MQAIFKFKPFAVGVTIACAIAAIAGSLLLQACRWGRSNAIDAAFLESKGCSCVSGVKKDWRSNIASRIPWGGIHWGGEIRGISAGLNDESRRSIGGDDLGKYIRLHHKTYDWDRPRQFNLKGVFDLAWLNGVEKSLEAIDLACQEIRGELSANSFDRVQFVNFWCSHSQGGVSRLLKACPKIVRLDLRYTILSDDDVDAIGSLSQLEELDLTGSNVDDRIFDVLPKLRLLTRLDLSGTNVTRFDSVIFEQNPRLQIVELVDTLLPDEAMQKLKETEANHRRMWLEEWMPRPRRTGPSQPVSCFVQPAVKY